MDNGADPSLCNTKGYSAVHYAAAHGNKQNLELVRLTFHSNIVHCDFLSFLTVKHLIHASYFVLDSVAFGDVLQHASRQGEQRVHQPTTLGCMYKMSRQKKSAAVDQQIFCNSAENCSLLFQNINIVER